MHTRFASLAAALAATAALALPHPGHTREIGRLFFGPAERANLEKMRLAPPPPEPPKVEEVKRPVGTVSVNGIVTRSSGRSTTWVNGEAAHDALRPTDSTARVPVGETKRAVPLRVGETLDIDSGERRDLLGGGSIRIRRTE